MNRFLLAGFCFLVLANMQCTGTGERGYSEHSTVTVLYATDEWGLSPAYSQPSQFLVFLPLVARNEKGELEGRLAERWEHSPDYRTWTIHLRKGVRWHDGVPVTAHDIKFTLELFSHPDVLYIPPDAFSITVLDDNTYTISFHKRTLASYPLDDYTVFYPKHLLESLDPKDFENWEFWKHPVGNGPYKYVRTIPKTMMEFEANRDYYRGAPKIERVVLKFGDSSLQELLSGNVDMLTHVNEKDLMKIADDPRFQEYHVINHLRVKGILWNQQYPFFQDPRVRRALTLTINRRELHQLLHLPADLPIFDVLFTPEQFWHKKLPAPLPYDPDRASRLLDEAGWRMNEDGIREKQGEKFHFVAFVSRETWARGSQAVGVYLQAQLRSIGIQMDIRTLQDVASAWRQVTDGEFEAAIFDVTYGRHPVFFGENSPMGYSNPAVINLINEAQETMNPNELDRIYQEMMPIFQADLPVTFLYPSIWTTVVNTRLRGLSTPWRADPVWYMEDLWLEDDME